MALLAPQDWHPPRDHTMDLTAQNNSIPRQRSSPANDHSPSPSPSVPVPPKQPTPPPQQQAQQPYPYPVQQQPQGGWTPSIAAQPFYPSFYQNPNQQQQAYNLHGHTTPGQIPQQNPYFDSAANAQLAQWAYQQMMFNAQHQAHQMQQQHIPRNAPNVTPDYFAQNHLAGFNAFPSGTPPPPPQSNHAHSFGAGGQQRSGSGDQYGGFHPYRRPTRQASSNSQESDWRAASFQPPYGRTDAASSSTSVNSQSSYSGGGSRPRTNSNQTSSSNGHSNGTKHKPSASSSSSSTRSRPGAPPPIDARTRSGSNSSSSSGQAPQKPHPHHRNTSSSSSTSASNTTTPRPSISSATSTVTTASTSSSQSLGVLPKARPVRRSPLSQGTFTAAEKRMSRDDSDIAAMMESSPNASALRGGGLKGRLRRALSLNASQTLGEENHVPVDEEEDDDASIKASASGRILPTSSGSKPPVSKPLPGAIGDAESTATVQTKKKSRAASLFNSRLNASTDNISLSSTVSSASVMIRKLGAMGNLARRNSLAGITSLFKDKKDKHKDGDEGGGSKKDKKKKGGKGEAAEASISHATAEIDRSGDWSVGGEMSGLSPAAKLARQHTLKSNAEAAARAKAQQESAASASAQQGAIVNGASPVPETWEKNTATGAVRSPARTGSGGVARVNEDGTRVLVEDDDSGSEDGSGDGTYEGHQESSIIEGWDDDEDWGDGADDPDTTIRVSMERTNIDESDETEVWATNLQRSMERVRVPTKGILKHAASYDQQAYLADHTNPTFNRARANSDNSHPSHNAELGPLARIPSPDPDHIDGLSRHPSHSSQHGPAKSSASFLPTLQFESTGDLGTDSPRRIDSGRSSPNPPEKAIFNHPNFNSSAPTLSTMVNPSPLTLTHRSATAPAKRLVFANNLSVYDTFSSTVYDRRSEPATWSRLTPALAQRIKEELNSYKMEEMEVHAASRIHTQFFV